MRRLLPLLLVVGCLPVLRDPDGDASGDTLVADDTEPGDDGPPCDGTWSLTSSAIPTTPGQQPFTWEDAGVELAVERDDGTLDATRGEDGCLRLDPGALRLRLVPSRCAARAVRVSVVDTCGPACTRLDVLDDGEIVASDRNEGEDAAEVLEIAPAEPMVELVVRSRSVSICAVELDQTPLPEHLRPIETGALF